ncbi:MAG: LPS export ABC transporter periplasmic protein LptC [Paraperlucidibaca sp.]
MDARPLLRLSGLLLAIGTLGYYGYGGWNSQSVGDSSDGRTPDYIVDGLALWQTGSDGKLLRTANGTQLIHRPSPERFELTHPDLRLYSNGQPMWRLTSLTATSSDPGSEAWFNGDVKAVRTVPNAPPLQLNTSRLRIEPKANRVSTPERVTIISTQGKMSGTGLTADLQGKNLQLSSAVEVSYAPSR